MRGFAKVLLCSGDVVLLQQGTTCPADLLLVRGSAVINEADFTGEAVPVERVPVELESEMETGAARQTAGRGLSLSPIKAKTGAQRLAGLHARSLVHAGQRRPDAASPHAQIAS